MTRPAWLLFIALSIVWGVPYFFIKIALHDLSPAWIAFSRVALGALVACIFVPRGDWLAVRRRATAIASIALVDVAIPFYAVANGERYVTSSFTGLLLCAIPIVVALFALLLDRHERLSRARIAGLGIGMAGVATLLGFNVGSDRTALVGTGLVTVATVFYSLGVLLIKRWLQDLPMLATTAAMLAVASALLAPAALLQLPNHVPGAPALIAVGVLGVVCTAGAYVMDLALIARVGAARAAVVAYVNPAVAVLLGVAVLGESLSAGAIAGLLLVIVGSWLSTGGTPPRRLASATSIPVSR